MEISDDAKAKAAATYTAAADFFDHPANSHWARFGQRTIDRLGLKAGQRVLDVCCGSGASAIPAAQCVAPGGSVLGVDLAEQMLERARAKAQEQGVDNVEFRTGDMLALGLADASFDAVVCVFGIFFVADIPAAVRALWRLVRPGGQLAITTWGPRLFEPATTVFWETVRARRPDLYKGFNPWDRICDPASVRTALAAGGVTAQKVVAVSGTHQIRSPEDWWAIIMGSGYRGTVEQLAAADQEQLREANLAYIREQGVSELETNVVYALAQKV